MSERQKALLIILDGFGIGKDSPFNAIQNARMPFYRKLIQDYPHALLLTHGESVGLPQGVMGNSEVGHMTMGAGRVLYQDLTRISKSILDQSFFKNPVILKTFKASPRLHLMGLVSDGGVHSHLEHLEACLTLALKLNIPKVYVHVFTDGRDTPPQSGIMYLEKLLTHPAFKQKVAHIGSLSGRYYAMDRDMRWERVEKTFNVLLGQSPTLSTVDPIETLKLSYQNQKTDEFVEPILLLKEASLKPDDSLFFFNFRADRARELTQLLTQKGPKLSAFATLTQYEMTQKPEVAFPPQSQTHLFGEWLEEKKLKQFRIAETEKYAHVTFFFNGGREKPFIGEDRILIASPKEVPTYDLKPEMSAFEVASELTKRIQSDHYDFLLVNFANADMVGHTGNYEAAVKAMETLDQCLNQVVSAAQNKGYHVLITADHGNAEEMRDKNNQIHTQHTLNPVPILWVAPATAIAPKSSRKSLRDGTLSDLYPTLCQLMNLPIPNEIKGKSLIPYA